MSIKSLDRRSFCKKTLAVTAGMPFIIASRALGDGATPPASDRVTIGHIGVGGRGGSLLQSFLQLDEAQSVAVCDPFTDRRNDRTAEIDSFYAKKFQRSSYKSCRAYNDFRDLLEDKTIDAVVIATPDHWHVPIAVAAARAGKDMYVEKPLGISIAENLQLRRIIRSTGRIFQYGTQQRSGRDFRQACELARNGALGDLHTIHAWCTDISSQSQLFNAPGGSITPVSVPYGLDYDLWLGPAPFTPYTSDRCTSYGTYHHYDNSLGFIAGWGAHPLDIAQWGNDSDDTAPVEVQGSGTIAAGLYETVSSWDMWCSYANGVKMRFMNTDLARPVVTPYHPRFSDHGTTFIGSRGWVSVDRNGIYAGPAGLLQTVLRPDEIHLPRSDDHQQNFLDCIKSRKQPVSPIASAVQSDIISHLCDIAIRLGRSVRWDPENEAIIGDAEASRLTARSKRSPWRT